jgi:hypothetical protein
MNGQSTFDDRAGSSAFISGSLYFSADQKNSAKPTSDA